MGNLEEAELESEPGLEVAALNEKNPGASAYYAFVELEAGRLEWLAEHIRRSNHRIDPLVARKLLELLDGSHREFRLIVGPRKNRNSKFEPRLKIETRNLRWAFEVALEGGFDKRTYLDSACHKVGQRQKPPKSKKTVKRAVHDYRTLAMAILGIGELPALQNWEIDLTEETP